MYKKSLFFFITIICCNIYPADTLKQQEVTFIKKKTIELNKRISPSLKQKKLQELRENHLQHIVITPEKIKDNFSRFSLPEKEDYIVACCKMGNSKAVECGISLLSLPFNLHFINPFMSIMFEHHGNKQWPCRIIKQLKEKGLDLNALKDHNGTTALLMAWFFAEKYENPNLIEAMLTAGADPLTPNGSGRSTLSFSLLNAFKFIPASIEMSAYMINGLNAEQKKQARLELTNILRISDGLQLKINPNIARTLLPKAKLWRAQCAHCEKYVDKLSHCVQCKSALYCNKTCQKNNWKEHKKMCLKLGQIRSFLLDSTTG